MLPPFPGTLGAAAIRISWPGVLMPPLPSWQCKRSSSLMGRQRKASVHTISLNCSISNLLLEQKKQQVHSSNLSPLKSHSLQRVQAAFDSKTSHAYFEFLQQTNKTQTQCFSALSFVAPGNKKEAKPARAILSPPQTGHREHQTFKHN